jgi:ABC-type dipeptide/oligopeptide/nickel transport system ATPase component
MTVVLSAPRLEVTDEQTTALDRTAVSSSMPRLIVVQETALLVAGWCV